MNNNNIKYVSDAVLAHEAVNLSQLTLANSNFKYTTQTAVFTVSNSTPTYNIINNPSGGTINLPSTGVDVGKFFYFRNITSYTVRILPLYPTLLNGKSPLQTAFIDIERQQSVGIICIGIGSYATICCDYLSINSTIKSSSSSNNIEFYTAPDGSNQTKRMEILENGNINIIGTIQRSNWSSGELIQTLYNTFEVPSFGGGSVAIPTWDITPKSNSSRFIVHADADYIFSGGGVDEIKVDVIYNDVIKYTKFQKTNADGSRTGTIFPLMCNLIIRSTR
jgi:hypothetical protein